MAKIFVALYNGLDNNNPTLLPCFYETFIRGLLDAGNTVMAETTNIWVLPDKKCPKNIAEKIKKFNPDVCFLFNNHFYDISSIVNCPIVVYEVDSFLYYQNKRALYENPNNFYYLVFQTQSIDVLQKELHVDKKRICHVPFFTEVHAKEEPIVNNICFCGSKFTNGDRESVVHNFIGQHPSDTEKEQLKKCMDLIVQNPYITLGDMEKEIGSLSDKVVSTVKSPSIVFWLSDVRRINVLSGVARLGLGLYGTKNWVDDLAYSDLPMSYNQQKIWSLHDTEKLYNSHKIGINVNHIQATSGFGWRIADIMASNACLVSEFKPDFGLLFPGVKIPLFDSENEAYDICKKLLENENMRLDIVAQCQEIINKKYRVKNALQTIEHFLGISLINPDNSVKNGNVIFLPPMKYKQRKPSTKMKQIMNSFGLFISSLPPISWIEHGKIQRKFKAKVDKYIK